MVLRPRIVLAALLLFAACGTYVPRYAFHAAQENQAHIDKVRIGQTLAEVQRIMGKAPERRNTHVRFDGISIE
ncbi:MAG TPA: hypothetical protein VNN25_05845, partial [Thermoanaerobaculia bacterium]|nr:hypothetical protein [Thermoanaerobaculia bacterium]